MRLVASLTTIPSRYELLYKTILNIKQQTYQPDTIYVTIPKKSKRFNIEYPPLPKKITELVEIATSDVDYGPICKIYGALKHESDPDTLIITLDDDIEYPPNYIEELMKYQIKYPDGAISPGGYFMNKGLLFSLFITNMYPLRFLTKHFTYISNKECRDVDILYGTCCIIYKRSFFASHEKLYDELYKYTEDEDIFKNDDVLLAGYLSKNNIKRRVINRFIELQYIKYSDALSSQLNVMQSLNATYKILKTMGFFETAEYYSTTETHFFNILLLLTYIIVVIVLLIIMIKYFRYYVFST
jgi:GT2 family glycosyltransferase